MDEHAGTWKEDEYLWDSFSPEQQRALVMNEIRRTRDLGAVVYPLRDGVLWAADAFQTLKRLLVEQGLFTDEEWTATFETVKKSREEITDLELTYGDSPEAEELRRLVKSLQSLAKGGEQGTLDRHQDENDAIARLVQVARALALETPGFFEVKGPGEGDKATNAFMGKLRAKLTEEVPKARPEQTICGDNSLAVDFYLPAEEAIVEIALSLRNPNSEFERDILKALMAKESGHKVRRLVLVSKPGALKRHGQPGSQALIQWAKRKHGLEIEIHELSPEAI